MGHGGSTYTVERSLLNEEMSGENLRMRGVKCTMRPGSVLADRKEKGHQGGNNPPTVAFR